MSALNSILLAIEVATRQRDEVGKVLARIQHNWRGAQDQVEQLESYATDTESKWALSSQVRATPEVMQHYDQFMERLQQAIGLQRHVVSGLEQEFAAAKKLLLGADIRLASLNQLLGKRQSGIQRVQAGRDQKQLDEFAAMQHRRLRAGIEPLDRP
jgi:flagellar FliJ protein